MAERDPKAQDGTPEDGEDRPGRKPFLLRLPPELLAELRGWAATEFRSLNGHIEYLLRKALDRRRGSASEDEQEPPS